MLKKSKANKSFFCQECGAGFTHKGTMNLHYKSIHQGVKYPCSQCDYQANQLGNLKKHIIKVHDGLRAEKGRGTRLVCIAMFCWADLDS